MHPLASVGPMQCLVPSPYSVAGAYGQKNGIPHRREHMSQQSCNPYHQWIPNSSSYPPHSPQVEHRDSSRGMFLHWEHKFLASCSHWSRSVPCMASFLHRSQQGGKMDNVGGTGLHRARMYLLTCSPCGRPILGSSSFPPRSPWVGCTGSRTGKSGHWEHKCRE